MFAIETRKSVLFGNFMSGAKLKVWMSPTNKLVIFVSSTFTDTKVERDILMGEILSDLREIGTPHLIDVIFVDLRWGITDESTLEHATWIECSREIERCHQQSDGIFFLSLQSDKYTIIFKRL